MSRIQPPQFLSDLYRDLRDRRLLVPIAALLVAIVAVPVLLTSSTPQVAPPPAPVATGAGPVEPAVLAKQSGIRNYRERLEQLKSTNPFAQKFSTPPADSVAIESISSESSGGTAPATIDDSSVPSTPTSSDPPEVSPTTSGSSPAEPGDQAPPVTDQTPPAEPAVRYYSSRVDVSLGPVGEGKDLDGVRTLEMLPDEQRPIALFLGISEPGDSAIFLLSPDVTGTDGEGSCAPKRPDPCQFLTLKDGESRYLDFGATGERYRLALNEIHLVRVPEPNGLDPEGDSSQASGQAILGSGL